MSAGYVSSVQKNISNIYLPRAKNKKKVTALQFEKVVERAIKAFVDKGELIDRKVLVRRYNISTTQSFELTTILREVRDKRRIVKDVQKVTCAPVVVEPEDTVILEVSLEDHLTRIRSSVEQGRKGSVQQAELKEGFVYLVCNGAWAGWIKVGMTWDYEERLKTYNVGDPNSDYHFIQVAHVLDRRVSEDSLIQKLGKKALISRGEWFNISQDVALEVFEGELK